MIVKKDKGFITNSEYPNIDWTLEGNYVVDEIKNKALSEKIQDNYPYYDLVLDSTGALTDVTVYPSINPTPDKTTIKSDGIDTVTITSDVTCDWYDGTDTLLDSNVTSIQISAKTLGTIKIQAKVDKYKPSTVEIEVV